MGFSFLWLTFVSIYILSIFVLFHLVVANSLQSYTTTCHDDEMSALLQFKQSFAINKSASWYEGAYPKTASWKSAGNQTSNCCSWDGVECDQKTGHVVGLDLISSCLYGSINSNNSLFRLAHLLSLNLADNHFNYSQVPTSIRNFPRLRYLNLSLSVFSGQVPYEVSQLSKLSSLDLSDNDGMFSNEELLKSLAHNLTSLETLDLSYINILSTVPNTLANLSLLTSLRLDECDLFGQFPGRIFKLQHLKVLSVGGNPDLMGYFPKFNASSSPLVSLKLASTAFFVNLSSLIENFDSLKELDVAECNISEGSVPFSLGNLRHLIYLDLSGNNFYGQIPSSLGNLIQLTYLSLSGNNFHGQIPFSLGNLIQLTYLSLSGNNFHGQIPSSFGNLIHLTNLYLYNNNFHGQIPSFFGDLIQLTNLYLFGNNFHGLIPRSLFNLMNLRSLYLSNNNLSGTVEFQMFHKLQNLTSLSLSGNKLEVLTESGFMNNATALPKFEYLSLGWCKIREFPNFLRSQQTLQILDLSGNELQGQVPKWMLNTSTQTLEGMNISHNLLSGFEQSPAVLPWVNLDYLDISFNELGGSLLIPSPNITSYTVSNNNLTGEVSPLICNLTSLQFLDLSNNKLIGMLPQCLGNLSDNLEYLNLGNNSFHDILPQTFTNRCYLRMIDVSHNQLQGKLPRSLANCSRLEFLVLSNNEFNHVFPFWLATLPNLRVLALRHNRFHGGIGKPKMNLHFPELLILDLSYNNFTGEFPSEYIFSGNAMRGDIPLSYMKYADYNDSLRLHVSYYFQCSITITNKGIEINYPKIQDDLAVVDISSNRFEGKIPEFIGNLKRLRLLNISNNIFIGGIPSSLGNLSQLESLDLSQNKLSGGIPQQLKKISFLAKFNVSHNNLTGPILSGGQFNTFDITSYEGNPGLCGDPLPKKCGNPEGTQLPHSTEEENDLGSAIEWDWKFVLAGLGSGLVVGVVLADVAITRWNELFIEIVAVLSRIVKRVIHQSMGGFVIFSV